MVGGTSSRGAVIFASGMEDSTISRQFVQGEEGTLIEYVLDSVWTVADELVVVFAHEPKLSTIEAISPFGAKALTAANSKDPLEAIIDAFRSIKAEHCLLATERAPLLKPNVVLALFQNASGNDVSIPRRSDGSLEPLLAVYRKNAFMRVATLSRKNSTAKLSLENEVGSLVDKMFAVKYVSEEELREIDPELDSFFEVKDERTLQKARLKAATRSKKTLKQGN